MDIQVARFREVLGLLKTVVPRKPTLETLAYVLLEDGKAVATDMDTMVIVKVPEADISCLIPYKEVVEMLQYLPGMETMHIEPMASMIKLSWADGSSSFSTKSPEDFPGVREFVPEAEASIDIDTLIPAMSEVLSFAAKEDDRPVLKGVSLVMGDEIAVAGGDGFRMAYKTLPLSFPKEKTFVVPMSSVIALKLLYDKTPRYPPPSDELIPVIMAKKKAMVAHDSDNRLRLVFDDSTTAIIKLVDGQPPDFVKLLPKKKPKLDASVMASDLELAVRRASAVAAKGKGIIRMVVNADSATISAKDDGQEVESAIKVLRFEGKPGRSALNVKYLLDYLKGREGIVSFSWENDKSPISLKHQNSPSVLIMPMFVDWDGKTDEPKDEAEPVPEGEEKPEEEAEPVGEVEPVAEVEPVEEVKPEVD